MTGYLIAEEGPLKGLVLNMKEGSEWILGRDPDESALVLADPSVSRKHAIFRLTPEGMILENLSSVNPSIHNGVVVTEAILLKKGDTIKIGANLFRFATEEAKEPSKLPETEESEIIPDSSVIQEGPMSFEPSGEARWLLKVISGPNAGAEFSLYPDNSYILGKDPNTSDVVFHDLSVSRQQAKLSVSNEQKVYLEDLQSRNGTYVNGELLSEKKELSSQDLVAIGTTSFLVIDQKLVNETIVSPPSFPNVPEKKPSDKLAANASAEKVSALQKNWKETIIPVKHLAVAGVFGLCLLFIVTSTFSLFQAEPITVKINHESDKVKTALTPFPSVQYFFNQASGRLFLIGHVLTVVEKQELSYAISTLPFIRSLEDTVVIDELVWQNMNALFLANPDWQAVRAYAPVPGKFVLKGYVQTQEQFQQLGEYINANFPYPNLIDNQVAVDSSLQMQIQSILAEAQYPAVMFTLTGGDLILSGRVDEADGDNFDAVVKTLQAIPGIISVKNFTVYGVVNSARIDLSDKYQITGFSRGNNNDQFVVINQKIYSLGDSLNGMLITDIQANTILLEKDGIKFKINYNLQ